MPDETKDQTLLEQIREDFRYHKEYWRENYDEAEKDMDCAASIPPPDFTKDRKGRPCLWPDETSQYIKQANNNLRQNKRSIKVSPRSEDATDKDAEHRQSYIRGIEYASKAQSIYTTAFESCAECAFGYWRVTTRITGPKGEQEPRLARIPNQFTVYPDPDAREADRSDMMRCFVLDSMRQTTFARRYPKAKKRSFSGADMQLAAGWFSGDNITVAEYWVREEIPQADGEKRYKVTQYITNGLEILETNDWIGSFIPIIGVFGEELYVRSAGQSQLVVMSLIRRARDSQQMLAYIASQQAEEFGMAPRAALMGWEGTFDPDKHKNVHKMPVGYIDFPLPSAEHWNPQWGPPPLPTRNQFIPNAQAYAQAYEQWRRAIMSAMSGATLPTTAQRQNEKSGVALEKIQNQEAIGAFHITDNFVRALGNTGRQLNELITKLAELDSLPSQVLGKNQKDEDSIIRIAGRSPQNPDAQQDQDPESEHLEESEQFFAHRGQFEVTISDGPNYQSQREAASDFVDTLLTALPHLGLPPALLQQVLAIAIRLKSVGVIGDEMADLLAPPDQNNVPPQMKAILAQAQGKIQELTQELQKLQLEKMGKVTEIQGKMAISQQEGAMKMAEADKDREVKIAVAEITTMAQSLSERVAAVEDVMKQIHAQSHEFAMAQQEQQHQKDIAAQQAQNAQAQQQTQIAADQQNAAQQSQQGEQV
jgi:hypothetical protein